SVALSLFSLLMFPESYFGDSVCQINAIQDLTNFQVSLQFKTGKRSGRLLLAAGAEDYLSIELYNGQLQAKMNMGAGEIVLPSTKGLQLNNLLDHHVSVSLDNGKMTMKIDDLDPTSVEASEGEDLNIDIGVFLGGTGSLETSYLNHAIPPFRGCISNVEFMSHQFDILGVMNKDCRDTKEPCSIEFEASDGEAISFISPDSFVSFPAWIKTTGDARTLEMLMKTTIEDALLTFHPGQGSDFIALGVVGGNLKGVVDLGGGIVVLENQEIRLDDDQWHRIRVQVDPSKFEMQVDSQPVSVPLNGLESLDLVGNLYLGGIQAKMKDVFREAGYLSRMEDEITSESFIGCLGEIKVNKKDKNLQDALVTKDIHVKCEGEDDDYSTYYDEIITTTAPVRIRFAGQNPEERHCLPTKDMPEIFQNVTKLLDITNLLVPEGGESFLSLKNLKPTFDISAAGIRQSQIIFTLQNDPWYGLVDMNINTKRSKKFTLLDIVNRKIKYLHDGNEQYGDQIELEVMVHSNSYIPDCLKVSRPYVLPVEILPVNDIPQLSGGDISITENGRTRLSPSLIKLVDSDTRCDDLIVTVRSEARPAQGYLENSHQPGESIREFTCRQLKDGLIFYVHKSGSVGGLSFQVSDGHSVSPQTTFNLSVTQPQMSLVTNTGLLLSQGDNATIGILNLAASAIPKSGDITYKLKQPLRFGQLHLISNENMAKQVTAFHQSDLERGILKYFSTDSSDQEDIVTEYIRFDAQLGHFTLANNTFLIKITPAQVKVGNINPLEVVNGEQKTITGLEVALRGDLDANSIKYIVLMSPSFGTLQFGGKELRVGDTFSQQDVQNGHLSYRVTEHRSVDSSDQFQFRVFAENQYSPVYTYPIKIQADSNAPVLTNKRLVVVEGGENILNKEYLWIQTPVSTDFVYKVLQNPQHGHLIRETPGLPRFEGAVAFFSNEDLLLNRLIYKHDGTGTSSDQFTFQTFDQGHIAEVAAHGTFKISITPRNDYVPQRVVDKTFDVVRNGQRLLTTDYILFSDDDSSFNDTQLVYVRVGIRSGSIVSSADPSVPLFRFTQADLRDGNVLFVHHGADRERFQLQVSDGVHKTTALLDIQAGDPYLHVVSNNMVFMNHATTKTLNTTMLRTESNMDIRDDGEITYTVTSPPTDGRIIVSGIEASRFTQKDLAKGVVSYEHNDQGAKSQDSFHFIVKAKGLSEDGLFNIKISGQEQPLEPEVINNKVIISFEGEHAVIDQDHLKVDQADVLPSEIVFTIKDPPRLGHVVMLMNNSDSTASPTLEYIQSFTQEDINNGNILYVSSSALGSDTFTIDVSNGFATLETIEVPINIVPRLIPVQAMNFTVREGGAMTLSQDLLNISHVFYMVANIDFLVETAPKHGDIRYLNGEDYELSSFTWDEVKQNVIHYLHDGSETTEDSFVLTASDFENTRRSYPITFGITVIPVNDEPPELERNSGLEVLVGEESEITSRVLNTKDSDTQPEELVYTIEELSNGIVALKVAPHEGIDNFTQAQIDNGEVIFIHQGSESGGFSFTVTDGEHTSPLYRFVVTARQLTITMETEGELMVFPGSRQVISSRILKAVTSEDGDEISFSIARPPRLGRLIRPKGRNQFEEITRFTQTELESGNIYYEHQMPEQPFWVVRDSIELLLSSPPAPELKHVLPVTISYYATDSNVFSQLWKNKGLDVVQGQRKVVDSSRLDASNLLASLPVSESSDQDVVFEVKQFPTHGRLFVGGVDLARDTPYFLQENVDKEELEYLHDDSEASTDSFSFHVRLNPRGRDLSAPSQSTVVLDEIFHMTVRRRDSRPPELVSPELLLEVLQGSSAALSKKYLNTTDEDSTPDEVLFTITKSPSNGRVINAITKEPIKQFTQEDVDAERVMFVSDGSLLGGFMEFTVSDGKHRTDPYTLHIGILARNLVLTIPQEIYVRQGDDETLITGSMLKASTGGPVEEEVLYKITTQPKYASVMVDRQATSAFTQKQVNEGRVSVRFVKSTSSRDSVSLVARSRAANVSSVLNITVKPLVNLPKDPLLPRGSTVLVDKKLLDSTPLANKTKNLPMFSVIQQPQSGRFVWAKGTNVGQTADSFTQKDLEEGHIVLEIQNSSARQGVSEDRDEARFLLKAHGVPPAECILPFKTAPYSPSGVYGATLLKFPPVERQVVSRRNSIWAILIPILVILLLVILAAVLAYYLVRRNKTGKHNVQTVATKPKNGDVSQETFRKTDATSNIAMSNMGSKETDPEIIQQCRSTNPALKKNQYWV
uniref:Laminin G domain-containing protein n=1 Tax=Denticeps clupeoides TaxID=299321 RepID=A0AAY4CB61_9TELE